MCCTFSFDLIIKLPFNILMFVSLFLYLCFSCNCNLLYFSCEYHLFFNALHLTLRCMFFIELLCILSFLFCTLDFCNLLLNFCHFIFHFSFINFGFYFLFWKKIIFISWFCFALDWNLAFFLFMGKSFLVYFRKHLR